MAMNHHRWAEFTKRILRIGDFSNKPPRFLQNKVMWQIKLGGGPRETGRQWFRDIGHDQPYPSRRQNEVGKKVQEKQTTGWWFGTFFIFPYIGNNHPN